MITEIHRGKKVIHQLGVPGDSLDAVCDRTGIAFNATQIDKKMGFSGS